MLKIIDLHASVEGQSILKGLNLTVNKGEIHAIMGPNGAGKSTLARILAGDSNYSITKGSLFFEEKDLLEMDVEERSHAGLFLGFQYPVEIPGVSNLEFLHAAKNAHLKAKGKEPLSFKDFEPIIQSLIFERGYRKDLLSRDLNSGFSGGEKKQNEILQLSLIDPKLAILDETDSGLDIDALKIVAEGVNRFQTDEKGLIIITHYQRLLKLIQPDFVHVMREGRIVESGDKSLALRLEERGYADAGL
ncbi:MAG: Fe-S cluster assembly ATPase SufC [Simkaniaceae bacterium]